MAALGIFGGVLFLIVGVVQIYVGYIGIEYHLGTGFAIGAIVLAFLFRLMLPLTIGTFFGAMSVWGWPWYGAAALAAPGLLFIVPALITAAVGSLMNKSSTNTYENNYSSSFSDNTSDEEPKNVTPDKPINKKVKKISSKKIKVTKKKKTKSKK